MNITGLPVDGSTVYIRLWFFVDSSWKWKDYEYTAFTDPDATGKTDLPEMVNPEPGSTLSGSEVSFNWESNGANIQHYWVFVGTRRGYSDVFSSGLLESSQSVTAKDLPVDGSTLYVRLWYWIKGSWQFIDSEYTAFTESTTTEDTKTATISE